MANSRVFVFIMVVMTARAQKKVGDPCVDNYTSTRGVCTPADRCRSAKVDFQQNGIRATFCEYNAFGTSLVCCRDGGNILQAATRSFTIPRQVSGTVNGSNRRVSERKCEEYSREVIENVDFLTLPDPDTWSAPAAKCDYIGGGVSLIIGGKNAETGGFPHMAAVGWANFKGGYSFYCGGSLLSPRFVLTAGHCLHFPDTSVQDPAPAIVRLGDQNIDPQVDDGADSVDVPIRQAIRHPEHKPPKVYNDIALLELATEVQFRAGLRPACLWSRHNFGTHSKVIATGWGVTDTDPRSRKVSKELQKVSLSLLDDDNCDQILFSIRNRNWKGLADGQMCAGDLRGEKDTCQVTQPAFLCTAQNAGCVTSLDGDAYPLSEGDSGSPLQVVSKDNKCIFYVIGVTSFGKRCFESNLPTATVYTRVATYLSWIESIVWPEE